MTHNGDALSRFRGVLLQDVTSEQLDAVLGPTSLTPATTDQLEQANLIAQAVSAQRTYCPGSALPIPEAGAVGTDLVDPLGSAVIQPPGTEIWDMKHIRGVGAGATATATIAFSDGTTDAVIYPAASFPTAGANVDLNTQISAPVLLTNSLYLKFDETGGVGVGLTFAYQVVSL
jgi:hypothetical protein